MERTASDVMKVGAAVNRLVNGFTKFVIRPLIVIGLIHLIGCIVLAFLTLMSVIYMQHTVSVTITSWYLSTPSVSIPLWIATLIFIFSSETRVLADKFLERITGEKMS